MFIYLYFYCVTNFELMIFNKMSKLIYYLCFFIFDRSDFKTVMGHLKRMSMPSILPLDIIKLFSSESIINFDYIRTITYSNNNKIHRFCVVFNMKLRNLRECNRLRL